MTVEDFEDDASIDAWCALFFLREGAIKIQAARINRAAFDRFVDRAAGLHQMQAITEATVSEMGT